MYDFAGNVAEIHSQESKETYAYDARDRLRSSTHTPNTGQANTVSFDYDELGNLTRIILAVGLYTYESHPAARGKKRRDQPLHLRREWQHGHGAALYLYV